MDERRVIRLSWSEWQAGRAAKRAALAAHGLLGESRRASARPEARRQLQALLGSPSRGSASFRVGVGGREGDL